jgi:secretion/DNA translocation related CpaE-like protein
VLVPLADTKPLRRDRAHVVGHGPVSDPVFRTALEIGAESVLELPEAAPWLVETLTDSADGAGDLARVVGVVGGSGGVGATTFATALSAAAASQLAAASGVRPVVLVDADPLGPGVAQVAGLDDVPGACWPQLLESAGRLGSRSLLASLPRRDGLAVLGWGAGSRPALEPAVAREVLSAAQRGGSLVVVDLPRHLDPATTEVLHRCDDLVVVTGLTSTSVASALQVVGRLRSLVPSGHLVARGPVTALDPEEVAQVLDLPLAAVVTDHRRVREAVELGLGPLRSRRGPLARAVRDTMARVCAPAESVA